MDTLAFEAALSEKTREGKALQNKGFELFVTAACTLKGQ